EMVRVPRVDVDRVRVRVVGRPLFALAAPLRALRMLVEALDALPMIAAVGGTEDAVRTRARVPLAGAAGVAGREPEDVLHGVRVALGKLRRLGCFLPGLAAVAGAEDGGPDVAGLGSHEDDLRVAWIGNHVVHDLTQEGRSLDLPLLPGGVAAED